MLFLTHMRALCASAVLFGFALTGAAASLPNTLTAEEQAAGWVLLFDGKTMSGWDDPGAKNPAGDAWSIEDGCLKANANPRITEDLFTRDSFSDFELAFEWRISRAGNSGLKYRIQEHRFLVPKPPGSGPERFEQSVERSLGGEAAPRPAHGQDYVIGFEYQLIDDALASDAKFEKHTAGALYDMIAPAANATRPVGEFNESRLIVRGNHVEHWMNGLKVVDGDLNAPEVLAGIRSRWGAGSRVYQLLATQPRKSCPISLQNHGDAAWFRSIRIHRLGPAQ
jgi:hypothetical protein